MYYATTATRKIASMRKRIRAIQGGTSASKTISVLLYLIARAQNDKEPTLTSIVSESFPHLKRGAIRDFLLIMQAHHYYKDERWNKSDFVYTFETGSKIEFFSADQPSKVRGPRRERLFINEANNVDYESFDQLEVRTKEFIFLDWNPTNEFWFYTEVQPHRSDVELEILTYKDNEALDPAIVASIEQRKGNKAWWQVYGLGQLGEAEGRIYTGWKLIDDVPFEAKLHSYGLDFGYTNDPTAIVAIYKYDGGFIVDECAYQYGMSNRMISDVFSNLERKMILADSSEPKSIAEIRGYGQLILPVKKGPDSVVHGIQLVQDQKISVTKQSLDTIKEYRNYMWLKDDNGKILNEPDPACADHSMDAIRYGLGKANVPTTATTFVPPDASRHYNRSLPNGLPPVIGVR